VIQSEDKPKGDSSSDEPCKAYEDNLACSDARIIATKIEELNQAQSTCVSTDGDDKDHPS